MVENTEKFDMKVCLKKERQKINVHDICVPT